MNSKDKQKGFASICASSAHLPKRRKKGFTLIELLVVIAIIGLLSTLAIVALGTARLKSRDARRVADLKTIQTALELFNNDNGFYPASTSISIGDPNHVCLNSTGFNPVGCSNPYLAKIPADPSGGNYQYSGAGSDYAVGAYLEGTVNGLTKAIGVTPNQGVGNYSFTYGLVGWWKFDEGAGTTVEDSSGNGNISTWSGSMPYYGTAQVGQYAGRFNGTDNYLNAQDSPTLKLTTAATVSLWFMRTSTWSDVCRNLAGKPSYSRYGIIIEWYAGNPTNWGIYNGGTRYVITGPVTNINQWYQAVGTYDSVTGILSYYINGNLVGSSNIGSGKLIDTGAESFQVGAGNCGYFPGYIDDVRVYNRALTDVEVLSLYNSQK